MPLPRLVIGDKNLSSWSLRPWLLLRHFAVPFEEVPLALDTPAFAARIGAYSPTGRVPALWDGELQLWDSLAICEYANERWLGGRGWPAAPQVRAQARAAACEMHSGFLALRRQLPMQACREPDVQHWDAEAQAEIARIVQLWATLRATHGAGGAFLCGDFGIVDAMFAPVAVRFAGYGVAVPAPAARYMAALEALPAMREWRAGAAAEVAARS
ncbi:glutathione S-transferase [Xanthomonas translucens pv. arrhenatheri]|uniref:Glutathione S-transferase n=1 Tax=Xanthomonas graminis pv. arrhenatheri LMG 727 TaxID=1195923 RepID=A0A0K3A3K6_9XANT|nr:glutathione S-transferase family protein [Xanthomonas translucens]OAX65999.1 glutathione S-transferase [Xanthomonas translucens pv. arrhenatheri]UKE76947.1 glutathione S-transferase family protein [Xanthomonas translucens pv. arrhenatheri]CTP91009.1 glutathione S-transferase [Xanthomonas translucens pv. arrhenatheri LMG 727]